jgi:GNAT superfamily N-acetyltransferase
VIAVRPATDADIPAMSEILTASIRELCAADHRNEPALVSRWTANKSHDGVAKMLANPDGRFFIAEHDGVPAAVGCIHIAAREIGLNYVHPAHRFAGVSKALLAALEAALGPGGARLYSTETAHRFYRTAGWEDAGEAQEHFGMQSYPMRKTILA